LNAKIKKPFFIALICVTAVLLCIGLYFLVDFTWNGSFLDWFDRNFMSTEYRYLPEAQQRAVIRSPIWSKLKPLLLGLLICVILICIAVTLTASQLSAKRRERAVVTDISQKLRRYMRGTDDINDVFPKEQAEISAQISEIKSTLLYNEQALKEESARRNDLIAYLAHDLKTPLTSIIGYLVLLQEASDMPEKQKEKYLGITLDKAYRLERMINEFFEITRYNLQQISLSKENVDLYYMLVQLTDEITPILKKNGNTTSLKADENLTVYADPDKLARAFNNVLKNAAAYSYPDTEILIWAEEKEREVVISFLNKGDTIPPEKISSIFEKFYRLNEARSSNTGGAGLGLAIAREIVSLHGGTINAVSENNVTIFTITLPLARP